MLGAILLPPYPILKYTEVELFGKLGSGLHLFTSTSG